LRETLAFSLSIHALLLLAAAGVAGVVNEVSTPWVAVVSVSSPATPPGAAAVSLPEPVRVSEIEFEETAPPTRAEFVELVEPTPEPVETIEPPPPLVEPAPAELSRPAHGGELVRRPPPPLPQAAPPEEAAPESAQPRAQAAPSAESAPQAAASTIDSTSCDRAPVLAEVSWPRAVRRLFKGTVVARVVVDSEGKLQSVELVEGTTNAAWDADLLAAIREATFEPALLSGKPVKCRHAYRITFTDKD
jgi:TonB family protein